MQGDRGLAGPGHALDHQHRRFGVADDGVLVALDGGDDGLHALVAALAELFLQHLVDDVHRRVEHELHLPVADAVLALGLDGAGDLADGGFIARRADLVVVEQAGDRRAPVVDQVLLEFVVEEGVDADVDGLC